MSETVFLRRSLGVLTPIDARGEDVIKALKQGEVVRAQLFKPRNLKHHRKMYALLHAVYPHQDIYPTFDIFEKAIKAAIGLCDTFTLPNGKIVLSERSWAFGAMDQQAFEEIYRRVEKLILSKIVPNVGSEELEQQVLSIMAGYEREYYYRKGRNENAAKKTSD